MREGLLGVAAERVMLLALVLFLGVQSLGAIFFFGHLGQLLVQLLLGMILSSGRGTYLRGQFRRLQLQSRRNHCVIFFKLAWVAWLRPNLVLVVLVIIVFVVFFLPLIVLVLGVKNARRILRVGAKVELA